MANLGRRRGDGVTYRRGQGSVEMELLNVQLCLESLHPEVVDQAARIDDLESARDGAKMLLKVIAGMQALIFGAILALFSWGLNHMTFHSDWEKPEHSRVQSPQDSQFHDPAVYVPDTKGGK